MSGEKITINETFLNRHLLAIGLVVLLLGILLIVAAPSVLTQPSLTKSIAEKGEIGDVIAGTTAPIVGLIGSVLVFLSLFAQIQANRLVLTEFLEERRRYEYDSAQRKSDKEGEDKRENFRMLMDLVRTQNDDFEHLAVYTSSGKEYEGSEAARIILRKQFNGGSKSFKRLESLTIGLKDTLQMAVEFDLTMRQKQILRNQVIRVWNKIYIHLATIDNRDLSKSPLSDFALLMESINDDAQRLIVNA